MNIFKSIYLVIILLFASKYLVAQNTISIDNPPTNVVVSAHVNVTVNYNNTESTNVYVLVRFKSAAGDNLSQAFVQVSPGQGSVMLQIQAPSVAGTDFSYQAQMLELAPSWAGLANAIVPNVVVTDNMAAENTVTINTWPSVIERDGFYSISVSYEVVQNSIIFAQFFDREMPGPAGNWTQLGTGFTSVNAGTGSTSINVTINKAPGTSNRLEILLFDPSSGSWQVIPIGDVSVNVAGNHPILFGEVSSSDPTTNMRYYNRDLLECNGNTYNGSGSGTGEDHTLAPTENVYRSNWWVNHNWRGPIKSYYGEDDENGKNFWVEWQNMDICGGGHAEFDIRVEKSNVSDFSAEAGFGARLGDIVDPLECTFTGRWAPGSMGRGHINMTTWVYNTTDLIPNYSEDTRCDIIIHAFDNSGDFRHKFDTSLRWSPANSNTIFHFDNIGTATSNGITYEVLRTMPGGFGEGASYNLIPTNWPREFVDEMPTTTINSTIDVNKILKDIIILEAANGPDIVNRQDGTSYTADLLTEDWGLHVMEWTVTGQSGAWEHDPAFPNGNEQVYIPNSMGRFTFDEYFIPNPCCSNPSVECGTPVNCNVPVNGCQEFTTTTNNLTGDEAVSVGLTTDGVVVSGSDITYTAGSYILLQENFEVESNASFHAYITACD